MAEVNTTIGFIEAYNAFSNSLPVGLQNFLNLFLLVVIVVIYAVFIWKFYRFISTKNVLRIDLDKYNKSEHPVASKFIAGIFNFFKYIVIFPFLIFFWFTVFTFFLIFLTEGLPVETVLILSAVVIGAIRMTTFIPRYGENVAKEIAKLLPFTLLAVSITKQGFFDVSRILGQMSQLPAFFGQILIYLVFIIALEMILRGFDFIFNLMGINDEVIKQPIQE